MSDDFPAKWKIIFSLVVLLWKEIASDRSEITPGEQLRSVGSDKKHCSY
jgi:hypothetical protein